MKYTALGRSGLRVSKLCLGTMNFGFYTDEKEAFRIMDAALDSGINFFDTANVYGKGYDQGQGITEEIIGKWFLLGNNRRERVVIGTKVSGAMGSIDGPNNNEGLSAYKISRHIEGSLKRLKTDHVELYQMHHIDLSVQWDELWMIFERLVQQGKTLYIGSSNFAGWHLVQAQHSAKSKTLFGIVSEQHKYNLMCRLPELEVLPAAKNLGIGIMPWSPLAEGLLANPNKAKTRTSTEQYIKYQIQLNRYFNLCNEIGERPEVVALAWLLNNDTVSAPVIGPRNIEHLYNSIRATEIELEKSVLEELEKIFPGPGGTAPEAYSW